MKIKYEVVAPNIRRTVLKNSNFRMNSNLCRSHSQQLRHNKNSRGESHAITYPLIQETFASLESNVECDDRSAKSASKFRSQQIWKRCCKNNVVHYNAIPLLNNWLPLYKLGSAACWMIVWRFTRSHLLAMARRPSTERSQVSVGRNSAEVTQGNLGDRPEGSSPKK